MPPETLTTAVQRAVAAIDADQPIHEIQSATRLIGRSLTDFVLVGRLLAYPVARLRAD